MNQSLYRKLALAFILVAVITVGLVVWFIRFTSYSRFEDLIHTQNRDNLVALLQSYYTTHGSWAGLHNDWDQIRYQLSLRSLDSDDQFFAQGTQPAGNQSTEDFFGLADSQGTVIIPLDQSQLAGTQLPASVLKAGTPITVNGAQVGTVLSSNRPPGLSAEEQLYLQQTYQALIRATVGALLVAFLLGIGLARTLTYPLQNLKEAAQKITEGHLDQQVPVRTNDELGQLAKAFNQMSREVSRVNESRRQMTADIAHDLRTPLTVISGYVESMEEGVLLPTPERLSLIHAEIDRLQRLVDDLRMLSLVDAGEFRLQTQLVSPQALVEKAAALFQPAAASKDIHLSVKVDPDLPEIHVDEARMIQVLGNLISNSLRYTPDSGRIQLSARLVNKSIDISVQDTGPGIPSEELPFIFDRFRRGEKSRHAENGESGLGLAIVKALVELHGGSTWAESDLGTGTTIHLRMSLPVSSKVPEERPAISEQDESDLDKKDMH